MPGQATYGAAKAFVLSYTDALVQELRGTGVSAATLCPGPVRTGFGEGMGIPDEEAEKSLPKFLWEEADAVAKAPIGRVGQPEESAEAVLFLLSDAASYISGTVLRVAGKR